MCTHSRSFGDRHFKRYVVVDPDIHEEMVDEDLQFLIIAIDGLVGRRLERRCGCMEGAQ